MKQRSKEKERKKERKERRKENRKRKKEKKKEKERVGVHMTEFDAVALQLTTAGRTAACATAVEPAAATAAGCAAAAHNYVAVIVDVIGGRIAFTCFRSYKIKRC